MSSTRPLSTFAVHAQALSPAKPPSLIENALLRGAVWSLIGVVFGSLLVLLTAAAGRYWALPYDIVLSTIGAAALTSLFYGSMRLAVMVANFIFIAMLVYSWAGPVVLDLQPLVFMGAGVGVAVGAAYGIKDKASRIYCAEAKMIAGTVAGAVAGGSALLLSMVVEGLDHYFIAAIVAPLGILAYVMSAGWFVARCHQLLPPMIDGALVGLAVGSITGLGFLVMAATLNDTLIAEDALRSYVIHVEANWGGTVIACALACFPVGAVRALLRIPWYDK